MTWFAPLLFWAPTLFDQTAVRVLQQGFPQAQFVLVDVSSREILGSRWSRLEQAIPVGSLVKPFTALAGRAGTYTCDPKHCWYPTGHGRIGLERAIADSCNSYFLQFAANVTNDDLRRVITRYQLPSPASNNASTLIGIGDDWQWTPSQTTEAFAQLATDPEARAVRLGMLASAQSGTAKALHGVALAKTGTAPCSHAGKAPGDGYVMMLYPARSPRYALLIQVHGVSGAVASSTAAQMLDVLRNGK